MKFLVQFRFSSSSWSRVTLPGSQFHESLLYRPQDERAALSSPLIAPVATCPTVLGASEGLQFSLQLAGHLATGWAGQ